MLCATSLGTLYRNAAPPAPIFPGVPLKIKNRILPATNTSPPLFLPSPTGTLFIDRSGEPIKSVFRPSPHLYPS